MTTKNYIIIDISSAPPSPLAGFIFCFILGKYGREWFETIEANITISDDDGEGKNDSVKMNIDHWHVKIESDHMCDVRPKMICLF